MIKSELIDAISSDIPHLTEKQVLQAVNHLIHLMTETLVHGERIEIRGFGTFESRQQAARRAHNPKTGLDLLASPTCIPHFTSGKTLKEMVDQHKARYPIV